MSEKGAREQRLPQKGDLIPVVDVELFLFGGVASEQVAGTLDFGR